MVHCLAGAHRAGTTAIAWLMYAEKLSFENARKKAKSLRDCISPIGDFSDLLQSLEFGLNDPNAIENIRKKYDINKDLQMIHEATAKGN